MHGPGECSWCYTSRNQAPEREWQRDAMRSFSLGRLRNRGLQFREQRRPAPQLSGEGFNCAQSRSANMMLHSLHVVIDDAIVEAEQPQEVSQKFVSLCDLMRQALAG